MSVDKQSTIFKNEREIVSRLVARRDKSVGYETINPLLLILGGSMRGAYGAGAVAGLHAAGLGDVFTTVVGVSTGAPTAGYFLAGKEQTALGASLYYEECTTSAFINLRRRYKKIDIDALENWMQNGPKRLDVKAIQNHPSKFYVAAITRYGQQELLDVKTALPDPMSAIKASMAVPGVYGHWVNVNGKNYCDGGFNQPIPINDIMQKFHPSDIVIIPNQSEDLARQLHPNAGDLLASILCLRQLGWKKSREVFLRKNLFRKTLLRISSRPNVAIIWPPNEGLHEGTRNAEKLQRGFIAAYQATGEWLAGRGLTT